MHASMSIFLAVPLSVFTNFFTRVDDTLEFLVKMRVRWGDAISLLLGAVDDLKHHPVMRDLGMYSCDVKLPF